MDTTQIAIKDLASKDKSLLMRATDCVDGTDGTHAKAKLALNPLPYTFRAQ